MSVEETRTTRVTDEPRVVHHHTTEVREDTGSSAAWWIGALVAIVAILAVVFMVTREPDNTAELQNAMEQGRLVGSLESVGSGLSSAQQAAEDAARRASEAASNAASAASSVPDRVDINIPAPEINVAPITPAPQPVVP